MSYSNRPCLKVTWNTPDGKPPESYRLKELGEERRRKLREQQQAEELSPPPPVSPLIGESDEQPVKEETTQGVADKDVAQFAPGDDAANFHHQDQGADESPQADAEAAADGEADDATSSGAVDWDEVAAALAELTEDESEPTVEEEVVKVARRNTQKLTVSEEDRFLMCLTYGLSMRQAAAAVGCHHTTLVKRAKRDKAFAKLIEHAKSKARTDPLIEVQQASRKSWRAAAWLLTYLERRDNRGQAKAS